MRWVVSDRLGKIALALGLRERAAYWSGGAHVTHAEISKRAWNQRRNSFAESSEGVHLDASLLSFKQIIFHGAAYPRFAATVAAIERELKRGEFMFRYAQSEDFGVPETALLVYTFGYVDALAALCRKEQARGS